jgi:hypothetical protein
METKGNMLNKSVQILAYADYVDIVGRTKNAVKKAYTILLKAARRMGLLSINQDNSKYMEAIDRPTTQSDAIIDTHRIEVVKEFKISVPLQRPVTNSAKKQKDNNYDQQMLLWSKTTIIVLPPYTKRQM